MGIKISTITIYELREEFKQFSDESIYWLKNDERNLNIFNKLIRFFILLKKVLKKKYSILIGVTSNGNYFPALIFFLLRKKAKKRIYFPYDIAYFRYKDYKTYPWYTRWSEKYNFRCCDGIIHKGPEDELKYLPKEFKALEKPSIQFLPYCDEDMMVEMDQEFFDRKLSKKDGDIHLVYVGGVYHNDKAHFNTIDIFKVIIKQKLHIHVYSQIYDRLVTDPQYKNLCENKYFHLHEPIYTNELQKEISKYDWGVFIFNFNFEFISTNWAKTSFGNKISSYFEGGLPVIVNSNQIFVSKFITDSDIGVVLDDTEIIKTRIYQIDYSKLVKNVKDFRNYYSYKHNIGILMKFIESINVV